MAWLEPEKEYRKISLRARLFLRYDRSAIFCFFSGVLGLFIGLPVIVRFYELAESDIVHFFRTMGLIVIGFPLLMILLMIIGEILSGKSEPYILSMEEWLFLDVYSAIKYLNTYFEGEVEFYRNKSVKKLRRISKKIVEKWSIGRLKVVRNLAGECIRSFKRNFEEKLLSAIESGNAEELNLGYAILVDLSKFLIDPNPSIEYLRQLNERMSVLTKPPSEELELKDRILMTIESYPKLQHSIFLVIFGVISSFVYVLGVYYLSIPKEYVFSASLGFLGVLLLVYFDYLR